MELIAAALVALLGGPADPAGPVGAQGGAAGLAPQQVDDIVVRMAREGNVEGLAHFRKGDYPAALSAFLEAHALAPSDAELTNNLAFTYHKLGNRAEAERYYLRTLELDPGRHVAYLNLADFLMEDGQPSALSRANALLVKAREVSGNTLSIIRRQARVAARLGDFEQARALYEAADDALSGEPAAVRDELYLEVGDFMRDFGRQEEARSWYRMVSPAAAERAQAKVRQIEIDTEAKRFGWSRRPLEISSRARSHLERAQAYLHQQHLQLAEDSLREALRISPGFTAARVALGDLHRQRGDERGAETEYLRAMALDPGDLTTHLRLGEIYVDGERAPEAALLLERAAQLESNDPTPLLLLARAYRQVGDLPRALENVTRYLAQIDARIEGEDAEGPLHEQRQQARLLRSSLEELLGRDEPVATHDADGQGGLRQIYNRVRVLLHRGETDAAMAELARATEEPKSASLRNLKARLLAAVGQRKEAEALYRASLALHPEQPAVRTELGLLLAESGDPEGALRELDSAAAQGDRRAELHRGRLRLLAHRDLPWLAQRLAWQQLWASYRSLPTDGADDLAPEMAAMRRRYRQELVTGAAWWMGPPVLMVILVTWPWRRRRRGETLAGLLTQHPETGPEVQRVLSSIRHEVLKHHTMMLTGLVERLSSEEGGAEQALAAAHALGENGGPLRRLRGYADQLQRIGRARGVELNLRHKDRALSALLRGFAELEKVGPVLRRWDTLSGRARARTVERLRRVAQRLNVEAYGQVMALLEQLRSLAVDRELLQRVFADTLAEPALRALHVAPLEIQAEVEFPVSLALPRSHFEDILRNVLRNAVQAQAPQSEGPIRVGLGVTREVHPITGHARVRIEVRDPSPKALSTEQLRQRDIEGGLGLTADLVSRYQGTMLVQPSPPPWHKAVVIKLPAPERG